VALSTINQSINITTGEIIMFNLIISLQCLNKDGVKIVLDVTYQYKVKASKLREVILDFRDKDGYTKVLKYAGMSL
jgi:hypothetical protein